MYAIRSYYGINWMTNNSSGSLRSYYYAYDALNRLTDAFYGENDVVNSKFNERISGYDKNGNINGLIRYSQNPYVPSLTVGIDNLSYQYDGNRLMSVTDSYGLSTYGVDGFTDNSTTGDDYAYDVNGNLTLDNNKGITSIEYNHLNLPEK